MVGDWADVEEGHLVAGRAVAAAKDLAALWGTLAARMRMGEGEEEDVADCAAVTGSLERSSFGLLI